MEELNKYQEALDGIKQQLTTALACMGLTPGENTRRRFELLQELITEKGE